MATLSDKLFEMSDTFADLKSEDTGEFTPADDPAAFDTETGAGIGDVVHRPTPDAPFAVGLSDRANTSGFVKIYNTRTHEEVAANTRDLSWIMAKLHKDEAYPKLIGTPVFSRRPTGVRKYGTDKCMLHPDSPGRAEYDELSLPQCFTAQISGTSQVILHMKARHKQEWAIIQAKRKETERQEDRDSATKQAEALTLMAQNLTARRSAQAADKANDPLRPFVALCEQCDYVTNGKSQKQANQNLNLHSIGKHKAEAVSEAK